MQRSTQVGQRNHRPEGTHRGHHRNHQPGGGHCLRLVQPGSRSQHGQIKQLNHRTGDRAGAGSAVALTQLGFAQRIGVPVQSVASRFARTVLQNFQSGPADCPVRRRKAPPRASAVPCRCLGSSGRPAAAAYRPPSDNPPVPARPEGVEPTDKRRHQAADQQSDEHRGNRVRVKYFKLDVRGDQKSVSPRSRPSSLAGHSRRRARNTLSRISASSEGDEVIAGLLAVTQHAARHCAQPQRRKQSAEAQGPHASRRAQYARTAQYRNENGAQKPARPAPLPVPCSPSGAHQLYQPPHNLKIASLHPASSCSSAC